MVGVADKDACLSAAFAFFFLSLLLSRSARACCCMASASYKGRAIAESFGKRLANQIRAAKPQDPAPFSIAWRASHFAAQYEKEIEEHVRPAVVPDHAIDARSDKYWGPHPTTGVFGPADLDGAAGLRHTPASGNGGSSALDLTVRFRPLELDDLDKSHHV